MANVNLRTHIKRLLQEYDQINEDRAKLLRLVADLMAESIQETGKCDIITICTHNSRRSQLSEAWIKAGSQHFGLSQIEAYSGGTEATAFNLRMVIALRQYAFYLHTDGPRTNPFYALQALQKTKKTHVMFSKVYDHPNNPREDFIALMVCNSADEACPIVPGAKHRISLPYLDPKEYDDTPMEDQMYREKVEEIGREILYLLNQVSKSLN